MPSAPPQILANGSASSPAAPPTVAAGVSQSDPGVIVGGTLTPNATGYLPVIGASNSRPLYATAAGIPATGIYRKVEYTGTRWMLAIYSDSALTGSWQANTGSQATPDLASGWAAISGGPSESGTPTMTLVTKASPLQIAANGSASTPGAPPVPEASYLAARGLVVSGTLTPDVAGFYPLAGTFGGKDLFTSDGAEDIPATGTQDRICFVDPLGAADWMIVRHTDGLVVAVWLNDYAPDPAPELPIGSGFAPVLGATGSPVITERALSAPPQVAANGSSSTPTPPPAIV